MFVIESDRGCKRPSGLRVQNGWRELSTNCQEECFCIKNEFSCQSKACDLNANQCVVDAFGDNFCYPIDTSCSPGTTITPSSTITWPLTTTTRTITATTPTTTSTTRTTTSTTRMPSTTIIPSFAVDRVIDIQRNQQVGTIDNYYQNYEFSMEVRVHNLHEDLGYIRKEPSITGFLIKKYDVLENVIWLKY